MMQQSEAAAERPDRTDLLNVLGSKYTVDILDATAEGERTARELIEACDVPRSTLYRRIASLADHDLLATGQRLDSEGDHRKVVATNLDELRLVREGDAYRLSLALDDPAIDRWGETWERLRGRRGRDGNR